ncbi:MAG: hypothetical protein IIZ39_02570, partial [Blautia sp.]|nr:hypothetical protein [Blautia sp.]
MPKIGFIHPYGIVTYAKGIFLIIFPSFTKRRRHGRIKKKRNRGKAMIEDYRAAKKRGEREYRRA